MKTKPDVFLPPHAHEAEKAVLGSILKDPAQLHLVFDRANLSYPHFYNSAHQKIFKSMEELDAKGHPIDLISVAERLFFEKTDEEHDCDQNYLIDLIEKAPVTQNIEEHANLIKKKYLLRKIVSACNETVRRAVSSDREINSFIEEIEREFLEITNAQDPHKGLVGGKEVLVSTLEKLEERIANEGMLTGISSGFDGLDEFTGGWQQSDLIIIAARPGMGKTALELNCAMNALKHSPKNRVAVFTLEMSKEQLMERLISAEAKIDSAKLRKGQLSERERDYLIDGARRLNHVVGGLVIDETPGLGLHELRSRCRRYKKERGLNLIVIDYLQLMSGTDTARKQGREREISEISMGLKALAKELAVPIIALAQLNRGPDARPDKRPRVSDLRESGSMEQDADQILFIYRDEYYNPNSELTGKSEVMIAKNRHGEVGKVYLAWLPNFVSFHNLAKDS